MEFRFGETNVFCVDRERSLAFYRDVLGFAVAQEEDGAVRLRAGSRRLLLLPFAGPASQRRSYGVEPTVSFDLLVDDVDAAHAYLVAHGVEIEAPPSAGRRHLFCRDPDGLVIEVIEDPRS